jgi:hypothetical protein
VIGVINVVIDILGAEFRFEFFRSPGRIRDHVKASHSDFKSIIGDFDVGP